MPEKRKPSLQIVTIGHIDSGKSTTFGHLLYLLGEIKESEFSEDLGARKFSAPLAHHKGGRDVGSKKWFETGHTQTIDWVKFETPKHFVSLLDAPGHRQLVKVMITGAAQADAAVLFLDARRGKFETGIQSRDPKTGKESGQTREHLWLARALGIEQLIMLVNAIDDSIPPWSQERFEQIKRETTELLKKSSIEPENVPFIPVSGWTGDNLVKPSSNLGWYRGQTLLEAIDSLTPPREEKEKLPLRIPIFDVFRVKGAGTVPIGVVLSGTLRLGDVVRVEPLGRECEVRSIETYHMPIEVAVPGDGIGFALKGVAAEELERGSVVCSPKAPATVADSSRRIIARVFISPVAGAGLAFGGITVGMYPEIHVQSAHVKCRVVDIKREVGSTETLPMLEPEQVGVVEFQVIPGKKVVIEKFSTSPEFGRFAIRSGGITIGAGVVLDIVLGK